jgi:gas vesicle protein
MQGFKVDTNQFQWASVIVPTAAGLLGAIVGGVCTLIAASRSTRAATKQALAAQQAEWQRQEQSDRERLGQKDAQFRRELLTRSVDILLDALWTKERRLCDALHLARTNLVDCPPDINDKALQDLGTLDLEIRADLLRALPFVHDQELKDRLASAQVVTNAAYCLRATGPRRVSFEEYSRAMLDVQRYFKWLRWNLERALLGEELPAAVITPNLRRPQDEPEWPNPEGMPDHA